MGWKKRVRKLAGKLVGIFMGETASQKANRTLKMFGINIFSKIIICGKLPKIPDNQVYFLSLAEMERLRLIFSRYNENAGEIKDSVLSPVIKQQIASNESIMEYFKEIEGAIKKVPVKSSDDFGNTHKKCLEAVTEMITYMYGLKAKLASKVGQSSVKKCVDEYLDGVLKAKPSGGVYWEEFLIWLSGIIDPNLAHLGELKTMLLNAKLPDGYKKIQKNEKNKEDKNQKTSFEIIEKVRCELITEYRDKDEDKGGIGQIFEDILSGKIKDKIIKGISSQCEGIAEQVLAQKVALPEIKLMNKLSSKRINFMGFKLAVQIKIQLESYRDSLVKHKSFVIYEIQNQIIEKVIPILTNYINLKNQEIKTNLMNSSDYESASSRLNNIKASMNTCFLNLQEVLKKYKKPVTNIKDLYLENAQAFDAKELGKFFRVVNDKKLMFFEEYVHELYIISDKSNKILDKVIVPESLYIDANALQIDSAKFSIKDKKWKTFNSKDISRRIAQRFQLELERIKKEIDVNDSNISKLETDCNNIKKNWDERRKAWDDFCQKYDDAIENKKAKNNLESIAKEIEELSERIKLSIPECREKAKKLKSDISKSNSNQKNIPKSFSKEAADLKDEKCTIEKLKSNLERKVGEYTKIDKNLRSNLENKKSKSEKQVKTLSNDFDKIMNSIGESLGTINEEHKALETLRKDVAAEKLKADETYKNDKEKKEELDKAYSSFIEAEKKLLDSLNTGSMASVDYWFKEVPEKGKEGFQNILNEKSEVFDKEKKCSDMLKKVKLIKEQQCDVLFQDVRKKIGEIRKLYTTTKTALARVGTQSWGEWLASWFW